LLYCARTTIEYNICQTIVSSLPPPVIVIIFGRRTVSSAHTSTSSRLGDRAFSVAGPRI